MLLPILKNRMLSGVLIIVISAFLSQSVEAQAIVSQANHGAANDKKPYPAIKLFKSVQGEEALQMLGDKLPEIAQWYKKDLTQLKEHIRNDKSLWVDNNGKLFFADNMAPASGTSLPQAGSSITQATKSYPLEQTFLLHSRPGSNRTLYLDFTGHTFTAAQSVWPSYLNGGLDVVAPPWDIDGNPLSYNDQERQIIQNIWQRVSEDYSAFDVDVTTEEPVASKLTRTDANDVTFGNRILISPIGWYKNNGSGVAYLFNFDDYSEYYKIGLVFPERLGNDPRLVAECASHESGHTLGLQHQGTTTGATYYDGQGDWAPIMGNNYNRYITHWSKGEYTNANNTEDALQIMTSTGISYFPDDYGNTVDTAAALIPNGTAITATGVIERNTDVDAFTFTTGAGNISININPAPNAPNLNIRADLFNASGTLIATADPLSNMSASITANVPAGSYYLLLRGVGEGDPKVSGYSNYSSIGQYILNGIIVPTSLQVPVAQIGATPTIGMSPLSVQFSSSASFSSNGTIVSTLWNFGDNTSSSEANPTKVYSSSGSFTASLKVTDSAGLSNSSSVVITVQNATPVARITASTASGTAPLIVNFDGSSSSDPDGSVVSYVWDFGDGSSAVNAAVSHVYSIAGTFKVQLTITDNNGATGTASTTITVNPDPSFIQAPSNLSATATKTTVKLTWSDNSTNEEGFYVERAVKTSGRTSPSYQRVATLSANTATLTDTVSSGTYLYRIQAFNLSTGKTSAYSSSVQIKTAVK